MANYKVKGDVIVVGAGPAGLMCAVTLKRAGLDVSLIDKGLACEHRNRNWAEDCAEGVGGAGLFSDGKFSGHPAGSGLYQRLTPGQIGDAARELHAFLRSYGVNMPNAHAVESKQGGWKLKPYPCIYVDLKTRMAIIHDLQKECESILRLGLTVQRVFPGEGSVPAIVTTDDDCAYMTKNVVVATGRFGQEVFPPSRFDKTFKRVEVGVRIEGPADHPFWTRLAGTDPKYTRRLGPYEWRTFCCCRNGETVLTQTGGVWTYSGRADCPEPTGLSNIGFNVRCLDSLELPCGFDIVQRLRDRPNHVLHCGYNQSEFAQSELKDLYGEDLGNALVTGLQLFMAEFAAGLDLSSFKLKAPVCEGVGFYPTFEGGGLKLWHAPDVRVIGDATGVFRGIVPAMISGIAVAQDIIKEKKQQNLLQ